MKNVLFILMLLFLTGCVVSKKSCEKDNKKCCTKQL